jgi:hypothetical protein
MTTDLTTPSWQYEWGHWWPQSDHGTIYLAPDRSTRSDWSGEVHVHELRAAALLTAPMKIDKSIDDGLRRSGEWAAQDHRDRDCVGRRPIRVQPPT